MKQRNSKEKKRTSKKKVIHTFESDVIQKRVKRLFDGTQTDLSLVVKDKKLLKKHIDFINSMPYCSMYRVLSVPVSHERLTLEKRPKIFISFNECYKPICRRWFRMIEYCYYEKNECYQFFGKRGIKMCEDFLDCKKFCIWCLKNGLIDPPDSYRMYLIRKDKSGDYDPNNIKVISEKQLHNNPNVPDALDAIILAKNYQDHHHESVSFMSAYTRYYLNDFQLEDAIMTPYIPASQTAKKTGNEITIGFSPQSFYRSVADENSCTFSEFWSRMHMVYMSKIPPRPYDLLKPDFSTVEHVATLGVKSYKQLWEESLAEKNSSDPEVLKSKYSKLEQDLLKNPDLKNISTSVENNSLLEEFIREL